MSNVMEDVDFKTKDFNRNEAECRHPMWVTSGHYVYHLTKNNTGRLCCLKDGNQLPVCSPRSLLQLCIYRLIGNPRRLRRVPDMLIPASLYPKLLTEAIFYRELQAIDFLISSWPMSILDIQSVLPMEDNIHPGYMTVLCEGQESMSLVDGIMIGLLNSSDNTKLRVVNFTGFRTDRKLCRELARLPILWTRPMYRKPKKILEILQKSMDITEDKVERYLNRIKCIYNTMDLYIRHGNKYGPITIIWDCKLTLDDVAIGVGLQHETPFRFSCQRVWMEPISEIYISPHKLNKFLELRYITHFEFDDPELCMDVEKFDLLLEGLIMLPCLRALSLPNTIHIDDYPEAPYELNQTIQNLHQLKRLNFSSCNIRDNLSQLLSHLKQPIEYLNLRDCRLSDLDMEFLLQWPILPGLRDLNLGRNNFKTCVDILISTIHRMLHITCLSISYSCILTSDVKRVVSHCLDCEQLKVLCVQSFIPPPIADIMQMLEDCASISTLQQFVILPEAYAFPGRCEGDRIKNRKLLVKLCNEALNRLQRPDIKLG